MLNTEKRLPGRRTHCGNELCMGQQKRTPAQEPWRRLTWGARLSGLGTRLTLAYMWVTAVLVLVNELAYLVRQELTSLIQELRPSALVEKGLSQVLRDELIRWSRQSGIKVELHLQDAPEPPISMAEELLRVVQEALSNVARHSQATQVQLTLKQE